jgi:hypothetical protein
VFLSWGHRLGFPSYTVACQGVFERLANVLTLKNSPSAELYGLQGFPLTYFCSAVNTKAPPANVFDPPNLL